MLASLLSTCRGQRTNIHGMKMLAREETPFLIFSTEHRLSLKNNHPVSIFRLWMEKLPFPGINLTKQEAEPLFPAAFNSAKPVNS